MDFDFIHHPEIVFAGVMIWWNLMLMEKDKKIKKMIFFIAIKSLSSKDFKEFEYRFGDEFKIKDE